MEKTAVKMVCINGMLIPESKVAGRLKALAKGRELKSMLAEDQAKEDKELADKGYSPSDIACLRHANRIKQMEAQGYGTISRCRIGSPLRNRLGTAHEVVENLKLTEAADRLLAESN